MATLEKIRNRAGILIAAVIGLALLSFILSDMLNSGNSLFRGNQYEIAEVAGTSIQFQLYQAKVDKLTENAKRNSGGQEIDEQTMESIKDQTWEQLIRENVMASEYEELGITCSEDELLDMVQGNNIHPQVQQIPIFKDQTTGQFNRALVVQFLKNLDQDKTGNARSSWLEFENNLLQDRVITKYNNLLKKGLYVTSDEAKQSNVERNYKVDISFVVKKYAEISDSSITVSEDDLKAYYEAHKNKYIQKEASRDIDYISFDVLPSTEDITAAEKWANKTKEEFVTTEDAVQYVNLNSDVPYQDVNYAKASLSPVIDSIMFNSPVGTIYGPYVENNNYKVAKLIAVKQLPDSVKARHILIRPSEKISLKNAETTIDSLKKLIDGGADFAELAKKYSADGSSEKGGDLGWFKEGQMVKPFNDSCFTSTVNHISIVHSQFGVHLVQVLEKGANSPRVQVGIIERAIEPSSATYQAIFATASKFAGENTTKEKFAAAITNMNLAKKIASNLKENDRKIAGLDSPRELVRWAYKAEKGNVSGVFELGNKFVIALLTEVREKGIAPLEQVKTEVETFAKIDKKAERFTKEFNDKLAGVNSIAVLASKINQPAMQGQAVSFSSFTINTAGVEPALIGVVSNLPKNKLSKPIKGNNGVYVAVVDNAIEANKNFDIKLEKQTIANGLQSRVDYQAYEALKELAEIKDMRSKFY